MEFTKSIVALKSKENYQIFEQKQKLQNEFLEYITMMDHIISDNNSLRNKSIKDEKIINDLNDELNNMNKVSIIKNMNKQIEELKKNNILLQKKLNFYKNNNGSITSWKNAEDEDEESVTLTQIDTKFYYVNENTQPNDLYEAFEDDEGEYEVGEHIGSLIDGKIVFN